MNKHLRNLEVISIISNCQKIFDENLKNKKLMFIYEEKNHTLHKEEMYFPITSFYHLTGVIAYDNKHNPLNSLNFYEYVNEDRLNQTQIQRRDNTTDLKLQVLPQLMRIDRIANMIGNYNNTNIYLQTEKLAGNVNACMGFVKDNKNELYVPNTALKEDIRNKTTEAKKIIAILKKDIAQNLYKNITYIKKSYEIKDILKNKKINKNIDLENIYSADKIIDKKIYNYFYNDFFEQNNNTEDDDEEEM